MPKLAANLSLMFTEVPFLERFGRAAAAGFKGVEYLFPYDFPAEEIAAQLAEHKLEQALFNMPPGDWDGGERGLACLPGREGEFQDGVAKAIEYARIIGCPRLHVMAGVAPAGADRTSLTETYVANLKFAAQALSDAGIVGEIEPINSRDIPGFFINTSRQGMEILAAVGSPNMRLQYDIYHMQIMEGDLAPTIERLLPHIEHMQLADTPGRHEPGTGEINYPFILDHIDKLGYGGWIGCEYRPAGETEAGLGWAKPYLEAGR